VWSHPPFLEPLFDTYSIVFSIVSMIAMIYITYPFFSVDPLPIMKTQNFHMATTHTQELYEKINKNKVGFDHFEEQIQIQFSKFENWFGHLEGKFNTLNATLHHFLNQSLDPNFLEQPTQVDGVDSSHTLAFHSIPFHCDPCLL